MHMVRLFIQKSTTYYSYSSEKMQNYLTNLPILQTRCYLLDLANMECFAIATVATSICVLGIIGLFNCVTN